MDKQLRNEAIIKLWTEGTPCTALSDMFNVTRARIMQIIRKYGTEEQQIGGSAVDPPTPDNPAPVSRIYASLGCTRAEAIRLNGGTPLFASGTLVTRYRMQRYRNLRAGVEWKITFPEWVEALDNGQGLEDSNNYLVRKDLELPFAPNNVAVLPKAEACVKYVGQGRRN